MRRRRRRRPGIVAGRAAAGDVVLVKASNAAGLGALADSLAAEGEATRR